VLSQKPDHQKEERFLRIPDVVELVPEIAASLFLQSVQFLLLLGLRLVDIVVQNDVVCEAAAPVDETDLVETSDGQVVFALVHLVGRRLYHHPVDAEQNDTVAQNQQQQKHPDVLAHLLEEETRRSRIHGIDYAHETDCQEFH